ncbi:MAG TPA: UDP-N-acetylmuramoyl-L-alanyl-D-glutamate--2,6-diaminopimelate ligase, partial [Polyangiaceae bacterium]
MTPSSIAVAPSSAGLTVGDLARALAAQGVGARVSGDAAVTITGLCQDSRKIRAGEVFAARAGQSLSGATFARSAKERGAVAIMVERGTRLSEAALAILEVDDIHLAIALGAEVAYGRPSRSLEVIGVTGTNGKTTVSWLLEAALSGAGCRSARLGTLGYAFEGDCVDSPLTTPEADEIARYAARARDSGATHLAMEVSSHALAQRRVDALRFACAAFTNLTQDHLDFHTTMEDYARAKLRLFTDLAPEVVVFNSEDALGQRIARETTRPAVSVSRHKNADVYPLEVQSGPTGMHARVQLPSGVVDLSSPLLGEHNLENLLITLAVIDALGLRVDRAARALAEAPSVPGRLERCDTDHDDVTVLVDYAHTPDALARVLSLARQLTRTELGCVFGCGGDR